MSQEREPNLGKSAPRLLSAGKFWNSFALLSVSLAFVLLGLGAVQEWRRANGELQTTLDLLIRAGTPSLDLGDYRSFTELSGTELGRLRFEVTPRANEGAQFHAGLPPGLGEICKVRILDSPRTSQVKICRALPLPWVLATMVTALLLFLVILGTRLLRSLEQSAIQTLDSVLAAAGVQRRVGSWASFVASVRDLQHEVIQVRKRESELEKSEVQRMLALRVTHDLRGPILALKTALQRNRDAQELEFSAIRSIERLGDELLTEFRATAQPVKSVHSDERGEGVHVWSIGARLSKEFPFIDFDLDGKLRIPAELESALENLVRNAAESYEGRSGRVHLWLDRSENGNQVIGLRDWGKGIKQEIADQLGKSPVTFGKTNGTGLGAYSAWHRIRELGGNLDYQSVLKQGTQVWIAIPNRFIMSGM